MPRIIRRYVGDAVGLPEVHPHRFRQAFARRATRPGRCEIDLRVALAHGAQAGNELSSVARLEAPADTAAVARPQRSEVPSAAGRAVTANQTGGDRSGASSERGNQEIFGRTIALCLRQRYAGSHADMRRLWALAW